jgi:DNA-binding Lrp family transcriptional regulator
MREFDLLDEFDLSIIHAVERSPRGSWAQLSSAVGIDAATAARRWQRLEDSGTAWATCYPLLAQSQVSAIIELSCEFGTSQSVAALVAMHPEALFVDIVTGSGDVLVTVLTEHREALSHYLLNRLSAVPGIIAAHTHPVVAIHFESGYAASGTLDAQALAQLPHTGHDLITGSRTPNDDIDWAICLALNKNGRVSFSDLASITGVSDVSVRRRMNKLSAKGSLRMMVEIASSATASPITVWFWARATPDHLPEVVAGIASRVNIRAVVSVAGTDNIIFKAVFAHVSHLSKFEAQLIRDLPALHITDRNTVIQPVRVMGRMVDARGYATGFAPIDIRTRS